MYQSLAGGVKDRKFVDASPASIVVNTRANVVSGFFVVVCRVHGVLVFVFLGLMGGGGLDFGDGKHIGKDKMWAMQEGAKAEGGANVRKDNFGGFTPLR